MGRGVNFVVLGLIVAMMATISACTHTPPAPDLAGAEPKAARTEQPPHVPNEYLVTLAPDVDDSIISKYYGRFGIKYLHALAEETFLLILSNDPGLDEMEALVQGDSRIKLVQPNIIYWDYR